jgi:lysozyme family protein
MASLDPRILALINETVREEGGFQADPADPGNWTGGRHGVGILKGTKYGISAAQFPDEDIEHLQIDRARQLFLHRYFIQPHFDRLPERIQAQVFDTGVLSGQARATIILQETLNQVSAVAPDLGFGHLRDDGDCGIGTVAAAHTAEQQMGAYLSNALVENRIAYLSLVAQRNPAEEKFLAGWIKRADNYKETV